MGKRGPKPGAKYHKRVRVTRTLSVASERQLVAAQRFNDRLDRWMVELERADQFPLSELEPVLRERFLEAAGQLQGVVIEGIYRYISQESD
jgi:hypothetical protein